MDQVFDANNINEDRIVDQIRCLAIDMIHEANSGHPGIVLGAAPILYTLYAHHMMIDVNNPDYFNRDRFVMSAGHGSALLYSILYMAGFNITLDDLKNFRKLDSITPGHPEYGVTPGVDMTTGPLGQGFATAVGMAIAEANMHALFNKERNIIDHYTYVLCGDGDLMEGISYEASSLAGRLKLNKLIVLYDSNGICLDGSISDSFTDDIELRFKSQGWNVLYVEDGNNISAINDSINEAKKSEEKPTIIIVKTVIGKYSLLEGTNKVHGSPLSDEDITKIKEKTGIRDIPFQISQSSVDEFRYFINERCVDLNDKFLTEVTMLSEDLRKTMRYFLSDNKSIEFRNYMYDAPDDKQESPRDTSGKVLNGISSQFAYMMGGAADTFGPNKTYVKGAGDFNNDRLGRNIYYGVREHAMGAITNGLALCGYRPYCSTFLSFSDYMKPALRLACLMNLQNIYIFSHDSISVGEDGPTHQPVEQLLALRTIPNLDVFRPADANEVIGSYKAIFEKSNGPSAITLSRNKLPILECTRVNEVENGGYVVLDTDRKPDGIVISCGEELHHVLEAVKNLKTKGIEVRVVSMPNIERFLNQSPEYIESVLPVEIKKIAVEAGSSASWNEIIFNSKYLIALDTFGTSGNYKDVYKKYGFDTESLESRIEELLK